MIQDVPVFKASIPGLFYMYQFTCRDIFIPFLPFHNEAYIKDVGKWSSPG